MNTDRSPSSRQRRRGLPPPALAALAALALAGCIRLPPTDRAISPEALAAPYPELAPSDSLLIPSGAEEQNRARRDTAALIARAARLRARAAALRAPVPVIDTATRHHMRGALKRHYPGTQMPPTPLK